MRSISWLACGLFLLVTGVPFPLHAQPASSLPAPTGTVAVAPVNPGIATLFEKHADFGLDCITCHDESPPSKPVLMAVCLSCHGTYDELADKTSDMGATNPHAAHVGQLECGSCHGVHKPSVNYCAQCHDFELNVP